VLVDVLRQEQGNDYAKVAKILQAEQLTTGKKKGFASSK
jgi:hypothetical protein